MQLQTVLKFPFRALRKGLHLAGIATPTPPPSPAPAPPPAPPEPVKRPAVVYIEETPNPDARKFVVDCTVVDKGSKIFNTADSAASDPLASSLYGLGGIRTVFMVRDFVTITREPSSDWRTLEHQVQELLELHFARPV